MTYQCTWVDVAHELHEDIRSNTDVKMLMGVRKLHSKSLKQKLSTKFSIEAELVRVSEYLPYNV